ncbi:MAG TPA: nitroreductase family deazaflavin-dependent oxidoreductase [Candidatus Limnocylindrales bacterium]|nr:nitroreductase family deazaflavin-dependent oxidoreductase [Candidatus Limnocylindrales bacterium]
MSTTTHAAPQPPARPLIRTFWALHKALFRLTGGRVGLRTPRQGANFGMGRLHTVGRRSGKSRIAMIGYYPDGERLITLAMNGWGEAEPAWWLNLQANPVATIDLAEGPRRVRARAAQGAERDRLWMQFREYPGWGSDIAALATRRPGETSIVVLEPVARDQKAEVTR